jgi:hypothetical protein
MSEASNKLFDAFRADHAILGRGFHDIATCLRSGDIAGARAAAARMDVEAGAHIVFEEEHFYPALRHFIDSAEIDQMYAEHEIGRAVIDALLALPEGATPNADERAALLSQAETMAHHIAECGTLFGAMGGLAPDEQGALHDALMTLREQAPRWSQHNRK